MTAIPGLVAGISVSDAARLMTQSLRETGIDTPEVDARALLGHALQLDRTQLVAQDQRALNAHEVDAISALAARRLAREPVARIIGRKEFWSLPLSVSPAVLVPRPETETVIEAALDYVGASGLRLEALRILDIGTGSGALLLALLSELPNAKGVGTDISAEALAIARDNAERLGFAPRAEFIQCSGGAGISGRFDFIVSNPPYIAGVEIAALAPEVRDFDPMIALDGGCDGLDGYRMLAACAGSLLVPGGRIIVELGAGQENDVARLFNTAGLMVNGVARRDLAGIARALTAISPP